MAIVVVAVVVIGGIVIACVSRKGTKGNASTYNKKKHNPKSSPAFQNVCNRAFCFA